MISTRNVWAVLAAVGTTVPAFAADPDVVLRDVSVDAPVLSVGTSTVQHFELLVVNEGSTGAGPTVIEFVVPGAARAGRVDAVPLATAAEIAWDAESDGITDLFLLDWLDGSELANVELVPPASFGTDVICGVFGFDMHPTTGAYWAIIARTEAADCWTYSAAGQSRWIARIDPVDGSVHDEIALDRNTRMLTILPDGTMLTIAGYDGINEDVWAIYSIDPASGATTFWHQPSVNISGSTSRAAAMAFNPDDGLLWYFKPGDYRMVGIDPATKVETNRDTYEGDSYVDQGMRYLADGIFVDALSDPFNLMRWVPSQSQYSTEWGVGWAPHYIREWVFGGHQSNTVDCTASGSIVSCTLPQVAPFGGWRLAVETATTPDTAGAAMVSVRVVREGDAENGNLFADDVEVTDGGVPLTSDDRSGPGSVLWDFEGGESDAFEYGVVNRSGAPLENVVLTADLPNGVGAANVDGVISYFGPDHSWDTDGVDYDNVWGYSTREEAVIRVDEFQLGGSPDSLANLTLWADGMWVCSFIGLDWDESEGVFFALAGLVPQTEWQRCPDGSYWGDGVSALRRSRQNQLVRIDPLTLEVTVVGSPGRPLQRLVVLPDGRLISINAFAGGVAGQLVELDRTTGAATSVLYPDRIDNDGYEHAGLGFNPVDGLLYMHVDNFVLAIDPDTWTVVGEFDSDWGAGLTGLRVLPDGRWLAGYWSDQYVLTRDGDGNFIYGDYVAPSHGNSTYDPLPGGGASNGVACDVVESQVRCTFARLLPGAGAVLRFDVENAGARPGMSQVVLAAGIGDARSPQAAETFDVHVQSPDLSVAASPNFERHFPGDPLTYNFDVRNDGQLATADVSLVLTFPDNVTPITGSGGGFACGALQPDRTVTCTRGGLGVGGVTSLVFTATAGVAGAAVVKAEVSTSTPEFNTVNNKSTSRLVFGLAADLTLTMSEVESVLPQGATTTIVATVRNQGPDAASAGQLTLTVPDGLTVTGDGCDAAGDAVVCAVGALAVDAETTLELTVAAGDVGGYLSLVGTVAAATPPELNPTDNAVTVVIGVAGPTLSVALGEATPAGGIIVAGADAALQLAFSNPSETQAVRVSGLTVTLNAKLGSVPAGAELRVVHDRDGDGKVGDREPEVARAMVAVVGEEVQVKLSRAVTVQAGETVNILILPARFAAAEVTAVEEAAARGAWLVAPFTIAGLLAFRRRRTVWGVALALAMSGAGCSVVDDLLSALEGGTVQITVTGVEAGLGGGLSSEIDGLPIEGPTLKFQR